MDRGLMARDDLKNVGFGDARRDGARVSTEGAREAAGFVAGLHVEGRKSVLPFRGPREGGGHA